jgi:hypothetical protein
MATKRGASTQRGGGKRQRIGADIDIPIEDDSIKFTLNIERWYSILEAFTNIPK